MGKKLAIKGHPTRGKEVIELLEMMGGKNTYNLLGNDEKFIYYVIECNEIKGIPFIYDLEDYPNYTFCTLEELLEYTNKPTQCLNDVHSIYECKTTGQGTYAIKIADGYKFDSIDENGNIIVKAIKPKYPTTYKECCDVLLIPPYYNLRYHTYERGCNELATSNELLSLQDKLNTLGKLIICRNAYWKIAGEEMGLDKPWKADWNDQRPKYTITVVGNQLIKHHSLSQNYILTFPTEEIRDAFYENFKDLIEQCKELL